MIYLFRLVVLSVYYFVFEPSFHVIDIIRFLLPSYVMNNCLTELGMDSKITTFIKVYRLVVLVYFIESIFTIMMLDKRKLNFCLNLPKSQLVS